MILSDKQILNHIDRGNIKIEPFRLQCLGSNSYDVHLSKTLGTYKDTVFQQMRHVDSPKQPGRQTTGAVIDAKKPLELELFEIPNHGWVLEPGILYLGATEEYTETRNLVPWLDGKSSGGRLGISIHATAGRGDAGFRNHWTLEISCIQQVRIYKGMPIGQLTYFTVGEVDTPYYLKKDSVYAGTPVGPVPVASAMYKNFDKETGTWR